MTLSTITPHRRKLRRLPARKTVGISRLSLVFAAEAIAAVLGFFALVHQARYLGPAAFATVEYAAAVLAWLLVLVRGGFDVIVYREAARRPRLIRPLTDLLLGLRLLAALAGYALVLVVALFVGFERGAAVILAGLALFASVGATDVGPRADGRFGWVALAVSLRALGLALAVSLWVGSSGDALRAAACLVFAETLASLVALTQHTRDYGLPRIHFRRRASLVLARRGAIAGLTRFARVTIYGADLLALGWVAGDELGPYAAARRIVFALAALGLVIPAMLGPSIAQAWTLGAEPTRRCIARALTSLWSLSLPAALGLALTSSRWMPLLFDPSYSQGSPWLALNAARLPWLLAASFAQAALLACRHESASLRLTLTQLALALVLIPPAVIFSGPWGVGWALVIVEAAGAVGGWSLLKRLGVAPGWTELTGRGLVGCVGLFAAFRLTHHWPLLITCAASAFGYAAAWRFASRDFTRAIGATPS